MSRDTIYRRYDPGVVPPEGTNLPAYWFAFCQTGLVVANHGETSAIPRARTIEELGVTPTRTQYLGTLEGQPCYSAELPVGVTIPAGMSLNDLRSLYGTIEEDLYLLAGRAIQIVMWDQTHQYCGRCGHKNNSLDGERAKKCPECGFLSYPRLSPATITAVLKGDKILLARYAAFRGNMRTIIAGFVEPGETLEQCLQREVREEVGVSVKNIKYFGSQPWPFPNSLMIGFTAEWESGEIHADGKEIAEADWYDAAHLPDVPPKLSIAREIIDWFAENYKG